MRVMHWNILADKLSGLYDKPGSNKVFKFASKECLQWDRRVQEIIKEIRKNDPDVFSLVELDKYEDIRQRLGGSYQGAELLRDGKKDGSGLFWRDGVYAAEQMLKDHIVVDGEKMPQALLAVKLKHVKTGKTFVHCVIHLKSDKKPAGEKLRVKQLNYVLDTLEKTFGTEIPLILNSDLNSSHVPLVGGAVALKKGEPRPAGTYEPEVYPLAMSDKRYEFTSAYKVVLGDEPWATSIKERPDKKYIYTIDYIFCSKNVKPVAVLDVFPEEAVPEESFPSELYPSDHECVVADVML